MSKDVEKLYGIEVIRTTLYKGKVISIGSKIKVPFYTAESYEAMGVAILLEELGDAPITDNGQVSDNEDEDTFIDATDESSYAEYRKDFSEAYGEYKNNDLKAEIDELIESGAEIEMPNSRAKRDDYLDVLATHYFNSPIEEGVEINGDVEDVENGEYLEEE